MPVIDVTALENDPLTLTWNFNGVGTSYDYSSMIKLGETDTSINADQVNRVLQYMAERHVDTISAKELGAILHLGDIGDVDITDLDDNSMLVYKKNSDCTRGCDGATNSWVAWNALDQQEGSFTYPMGYDDDGAPKTLRRPENTDQHYQLSWNANNKVGWSQPKKVTSTDNLAPVYIDKTTKELVYVEQ